MVKFLVNIIIFLLAMSPVIAQKPYTHEQYLALESTNDLFPTYFYYLEGPSRDQGTSGTYSLLGGEVDSKWGRSNELDEVPIVPRELKGGMILNERVEPDNPVVRDEALRIASQYPGPYSIDQVCAIYEYLRTGWHYVKDQNPSVNFNYANETINRGKSAGYAGVGDCDDFACLMASMIEAIGGSAKIIGTCDENGECHAFAVVYIGEPRGEGGQNMWWNVISDLILKYYNEPDSDGYMRIRYYQELTTDHYRASWLNLDWWADHPGGPFFKGVQSSMLFWESNHQLIVPKAPNRTLADLWK